MAMATFRPDDQQTPRTGLDARLMSRRNYGGVTSGFWSKGLLDVW